MNLRTPLYWTLAADGRTPVPCNSVIEWAQMMEGEQRKVAQDHDNEKSVSVSTVFLGMEHGHSRGKPLLFETMIFGGPRDQYQRRYTSWEEAERGHAEACEVAGIQRKLETWIDGELDA